MSDEPLPPEVQIKILNEWCKLRVAPSKIHGVGVFALRDIKKGERLYADIKPEVFNVPYQQFNKLRPEIRDIRKQAGHGYTS